MKDEINKALSEKNLPKAINLLEQMEERKLDFNDLKLKAQLYGRVGRYVDAHDTAVKALTIKSDDYELYHTKGVSLYYLKEHKKAIIAFDECLDIHPTFHRAIMKKVDSLILIGEYEKAKKLFEVSDLPDMDQEISLNNIGFMYIRLGQLEKAHSYLKKGINLNRFEPILYYNLAKLYSKNKKVWKTLVYAFVFYLLLTIQKIPYLYKQLKRTARSHGFHEKREIFSGPGALFTFVNERSGARETKAILSFLRSAFAPSISNDTWEWHAINIPYSISDTENAPEGDIDILVKRPRYMGEFDAGFTYRGFEVKTATVNKQGRVIGGLYRGKSKMKKIIKQLKKIRAFGCEQVFFFEIFILQRGYSDKNIFPSKEILQYINKKTDLLKESEFGYVVIAIEPSATHDDESGGIFHNLINILPTSQQDTEDSFLAMNEKIEEYIKSASHSSYANRGFMSARIVTYCKHCKKLTSIESPRANIDICAICKKDVY